MTDHPLDGRIENLSLMLDLDPKVQQAFIASLKDVGRIAGVNKGRHLFSQGEPAADEGYIVIKGTLTIENDSGFKNTLYAPVLVGEMKQFAFGDESRSADVLAEADLEVLRFDWSALYASMDAKLTDAHMTAFRAALRRYAWMHFLELEGEL